MLATNAEFILRINFVNVWTSKNKISKNLKHLYFSYQIWQLSTSRTDCSYYWSYICKTTRILGRRLWLSIHLHSLQLHLYIETFRKTKGTFLNQNLWIVSVLHWSRLSWAIEDSFWLVTSWAQVHALLVSFVPWVYTIGYYCYPEASVQPRCIVPFTYYHLAMSVST